MIFSTYRAGYLPPEGKSYPISIQGFTLDFRAGSPALRGKTSPISNRAIIALFLLPTPSSVFSVARNSLALPPRCYRGQLVGVSSKQGKVLPLSSSPIFDCPEPCSTRNPLASVKYPARGFTLSLYKSPKRLKIRHLKQGFLKSFLKTI